VETAAKSAADGYTLLHYGSTVWLLPYMREGVPWDALKDFAPISLTLSSPNLLVVHPSLPVNSVKEFIALLKTKPGDYNYSLGSRGTSPHLAVELFKAMTGVNIVAVPYKGNIPGLNALLAGEVHMVFSTAATGGPFVKSGKLRALAVTSSEPSGLFPGVPSVAASGLPGYESVSITGMLAPAKTPDAVIKRLNQEMVRFLNQPDTKDKFLNTGAEVVGSSPEEFSARIKSEMTRLGKVIKDAGIRAD
jgi:tripartite-type tricarboxylate transporter receptor subunit TctC